MTTGKTSRHRAPAWAGALLGQLVLLGACVQAPEPLGAATTSNLARQAADPLPEPAGRGEIEGGTGGRAGLAVATLRAKAAKSTGDR